MKWDEAPLWPVAVPSMAGFASACAPHLVDGIPRIFDWDLSTPFLSLMVASLLLYIAPYPADRSPELIVGTNVGMLLAFVPQLFFFVWFVPVILFWIFQSMYVWKYDYPAFRVGTWIGLGAVSGLFVGGLFAHFVL